MVNTGGLDMRGAHACLHIDNDYKKHTRHLHSFTQAHKAKHSTELFTVLHKHKANSTE